MQQQINNAFAALNERLHQQDQKWAAAKIDGARQYIEQMKEKFAAGEVQHLTSGYGRFCYSAAVNEWFGSKSMAALLTGHGRQGGLDNMAKNTQALIDKRDARIIKALNKKGITEIPEFELVEISDGVEGVFYIDQHRVSIKTILAGGYNIQRLHNRTLIKVK